MTVPRVRISGTSCYMAGEELKAMRSQASRLIAQGTSLGFGEFPIDGASYRKGALGLFKEKLICTALAADSGATEANHGELRREYRAERMTEAEARTRGVIARQIPIKKACPADYDWCESMTYNDVEGCQEIIEEIDGYGIPTVMYAVEAEAGPAQDYINRLDTAPLYTKYSDAGPRGCVGGRDEAGQRYSDSFHSLAVLFTSIQFVMRAFAGRGWTAWTMRRSCETPAGETLKADDLMFDFGMRVFVPVEVEREGEISVESLVMTASAAASNGGLSSIVPDKVLQKVGYERFIGAEFAKKVLLDAVEKGWEVKD